MRTYTTSEYKEFRCLAGQCLHTCCAGWEIDIDPETMSRYRLIGGLFGSRLQQAIDSSGGQPVFRMDADGRCPMLRKDGLCEIYRRLGPEALCQICADHPRYRNFSESRIETGLGLCCEAEAWRIVSMKSPLSVIMLEEDDAQKDPNEDEADLFALRDALMEAVQEEGSWTQRLSRVMAMCDLTVLPDPDDVIALMNSLEVLDDAWPGILRRADSLAVPPEWDAPAGRIAAALLFRHVAGCLEDGRLRARILFALSGASLIRSLAAGRDPADLHMLADTARMFSAEIEYSEENMDAVLESMDQCI